MDEVCLIAQAKAYLDGCTTDDSAYKQVILGNTGLCARVARIVHFPGCVFDIEDLVQEGVVGLIRAIQLYDGSKGAKFSTYATWWIRSTISYALSNNGHLIRVPKSKVDKALTVRRSQMELYQAIGRDPSISELVEYLGDGFTVNLVEDLLELPAVVASLDRKSPDDSPGRTDYWVDRIAGDAGDMNDVDARLVLIDLINRLPAREWYVMARKYNFHPDYDIPLTAKELSIELGVSRQCIDIIERRGIYLMKCYFTGRDPSNSEMSAISESSKNRRKGLENIDPYLHHTTGLFTKPESKRKYQRDKERTRSNADIGRNERVRDGSTGSSGRCKRLPDQQDTCGSGA